MVYGNITDWRAYALARGNVAPSEADDAEALASLQRASDYIRTRYVIRYGLDPMSENVIEATYIAAGYDQSAPGFWSKTYTPAEAKVLTKAGKIGWTLAGYTSSSGSAADAMLPLSPAIEALLMGAGASKHGIGAMVV